MGDRQAASALCGLSQPLGRARRTWCLATQNRRDPGGDTSSAPGKNRPRPGQPRDDRPCGRRNDDIGSAPRRRRRECARTRLETTWGTDERARRYWMSVSSLNIGRYMLMMITPTIAPTPIIMSGSMIEVSVAIELSTSSS